VEVGRRKELQPDPWKEGGGGVEGSHPGKASRKGAGVRWIVLGEDRSRSGQTEEKPVYQQKEGGKKKEEI